MINRVLPNSYPEFMAIAKSLPIQKLLSWFNSFYEECLNTAVSTNAFVSIVRKEDIVSRVTELYNSGAKPLKYLVFDLKANYNTMSHDNGDNSSCSLLLKNYRSPVDCYVYKLMIEKGGIFTGKTNCDELACGDLCQHSCYGATVVNGESPGGSSGGAAVAARYVSFVSFGTDTGGSVRQPAIRLGIYAVKPTFGLVSMYGITAYTSTLDHIGIAGLDLDTLELVLSQVSCYDSRYSCSVRCTYERLDFPSKRMKVAIVIDSSMNNEVLNLLRSLNDVWDISFICLPFTVKHINFVYHVITSAEFFSHTNRFDLLKFNDKLERRVNLSDFWSNRYKYLQASNSAKALYGAIVLSEYNDKLYQTAMKMRSKIIYDVDRLFLEFDIIITSGFCETSTYLSDEIEVYRDDNEGYLRLSNLLGTPSVVVPIRPMSGIQIIGRRLEDNYAFLAARMIDQRIKSSYE